VDKVPSSTFITWNGPTFQNRQVIQTQTAATYKETMYFSNVYRHLYDSEVRHCVVMDPSPMVYKFHGRDNEQVPANTTDLVIVEGVLRIPDSPFSYHRLMIHISFPDSVTRA